MSKPFVSTLGRIGLFILIVVFFPIIAVGALVFGAIINPIYRHRLQKEFFAAHGAHGRYILFVYDKHAPSAKHIEDEILPKLAPHATVLEWTPEQTLPRRERPLDLRVFHQYGGDANAVPMAILVHPKLGVRIVRFGPAFATLEQGHREHLEHREEELFGLVEDIKNP